MKKLLFTFISCILFLSCTKDPGKGGTASIIGKVLENRYDIEGDYIKSYYKADKRVYIMYGDSKIPNDDIRTSYTGIYEFPNLNKGKYTVYTYSECKNCLEKDTVVLLNVEIKNRGEQIELKDLVVDNYQK